MKYIMNSYPIRVVLFAAFIIFASQSVNGQHAQSRESHETFIGLCNRLLMEAVKNARGDMRQISKDTPNNHATAFFKFLVGDMQPGQKLIVQESPEPEGAPRSAKDYVVQVGYEAGPSTVVFEFHFVGAFLRRISFLPSM